MIISFALYSAWMLAVPFMGQALRARASELGTGVPMHIDFVATLSIFVSLFATGFFLTKGAQVRRVTPPAIAVGIVGTLVLMGPMTPLWNAAAVMLPVSTGIIVACWGHYYRMFRTPAARLHAAADVIIISNIGMILINTIAVNLSARLGLGLSVAALIASLVLFMFAHRSKLDELTVSQTTPACRPEARHPTRPSACRPGATAHIPRSAPTRCCAGRSRFCTYLS
jgi:hypothetical protein